MNKVFLIIIVFMAFAVLLPAQGLALPPTSLLGNLYPAMVSTPGPQGINPALDLTRYLQAAQEYYALYSQIENQITQIQQFGEQIQNQAKQLQNMDVSSLQDVMYLTDSALTYINSAENKIESMTVTLGTDGEGNPQEVPFYEFYNLATITGEVANIAYDSFHTEMTDEERARVWRNMGLSTSNWLWIREKKENMINHSARMEAMEEAVNEMETAHQAAQEELDTLFKNPDGSFRDDLGSAELLQYIAMQSKLDSELFSMTLRIQMHGAQIAAESSLLENFADYNQGISPEASRHFLDDVMNTPYTNYRAPQFNSRSRANFQSITLGSIEF